MNITKPEELIPESIKKINQKSTTTTAVKPYAVTVDSLKKPLQEKYIYRTFIRRLQH